MFVFIVAILGAAFTAPLQGQVNNWSANLTANNQSSAATIVNLIPLLFWILLAVGVILIVVAIFLPGKMGLALLPIVFGLIGTLSLAALLAIAAQAAIATVLRWKLHGMESR